MTTQPTYLDSTIPMIERLTERASKAITLAQEESRRSGQNFIGTEQILLGLIAEGSGIAAKSLKTLGGNIRDFRVEVEKLSGRGNDSVPDSIPFSPRAVRVLELSWSEAQKLGDNYIGTEHLLLAIISEGKGSACTVLSKCNIESEKLREQIMKMMDKKAITSGQYTSISETPTLDQFGIDLTQAARDRRLDPVVARDKTIERIIRILGRRSKPNPLLIGERGVGKSALIAGLAQRIYDAEVPEFLLNCKLIRLDILYLFAQREPASLIKECLAEAQTAKAILAIDELHHLLFPTTETERDVSFTMNWFISNAKVSCVGIAPLATYRKSDKEPGALRRYFQELVVLAPVPEEAIIMLKSLRSKLEEHHNVFISEEAIEQSVILSAEQLKNGCLPGKAVDVLDEACQLVSSRHPNLMGSMKSDLLRIRREKEKCIRKQQFERAALLREQETVLSEQLRDVQSKNSSATVTAEDILEVVQEICVD